MADFFGELPTIAVKTKKRTATASPLPRGISLLLLIPSPPLTSARVANCGAGSWLLLRPCVEGCSTIGPAGSITDVGKPPLPFLLLSVTLITFYISSLLAVTRDGWGEWQSDQDGTIYLVCLRDLQEQLLRRFLEIRPIEHNHAVSARSGLKPGRAQSVVADLQLVRDDAFAFLLFLLCRLASGDLNLGRNDLDWFIRAVQDGVGDHGFVTPLPHVANRCLDLLVLPLRPFGSIDFLLLPELFVETRKGYET